MLHESFEVQTVDYCKWELFQGGLWVIICSAPQGAVVEPRGQQFHGREKRRQSNTCWATDSQHETSQQACLLFLMSVIYMKEPPSPNRNSVSYTAVWLTGFHISHVPYSLPEQLDDDCSIKTSCHKSWCKMELPLSLPPSCFWSVIIFKNVFHSLKVTNQNNLTCIR